MRVKFFAAALLCAGVCLCTACEPKPSDGYEALNEMLRARYSEVVITVTDTFAEGIFLKNEFEIVLSEPVSVHYRMERFAELGGLGGEELPAGGTKTLTEGDAVYRGGALLSDSGGMLPGALPSGGMEFREEYFSDADLTGIYLKADVKDAGAFLGDPSLKCEDMKVSATFLEVFYDITVTFTSESGVKVEYRYDFRL